MSDFLQVVASGVINGMIYALVATGLSLIWGVMDVINFAHGDYLMVAMYTSFWLGALLGIDPVFSWIFSGAFLFLIGALTYRLIIKQCVGAGGKW